MYILFEEHQYKLTDNESVLPQICHWQNVDGKYSTGFVGYFYEPKVNDCVFILPKVLLNENEMLVTDKGDLVDPANIISPEGQDEFLSDNFKRFLYEFAVWIYRSVSVFHQKNPHSNNLLYCSMPQSGVGKRHKANTYLDVILSLSGSIMRIRISSSSSLKTFTLATTRLIGREPYRTRRLLPKMEFPSISIQSTESVKSTSMKSCSSSSFPFLTTSIANMVSKPPFACNMNC